MTMRYGAVAIILEGGRMLAIRRGAEIRAPGAVCFPGGGIEAGESEAEALVRELQEELGAVVRPIRKVWESVTPWQVHLAWWLAERVDPAEFVLHPDEVAEAFWLTPDEILAHPDLLPSNRTFFEALAQGIIDLT